jgi:hypothetical protein
LNFLSFFLFLFILCTCTHVQRKARKATLLVQWIFIEKE